MQVDILKIKDFAVKNLGYLIAIVLLLFMFKCDPQEYPENSQIIIEKEKTISTLLGNIKTKDKVIINLHKKVAKSQDSIVYLLADLKKKHYKKVKDIQKVKNYDLKDFKRFFELQTGSNEIAIAGDKLTFTKKPLDTLAKKLIDYEFRISERDIYEEMHNKVVAQSKIKDTIIGIQKEIITDYGKAYQESADINASLKKDLKKKNRPKIGNYIVAGAIGLIGGFLIAK